jgi:hypothetical protein
MKPEPEQLSLLQLILAGDTTSLMAAITALYVAAKDAYAAFKKFKRRH